MNLIFPILLFFFPFSAEAYLDPGSGSLIIQVVIGGIVGGLMWIKVYWKKISEFFSKRKH